MHPYLAEFIGTFVLVFCDCSSALLDTDYLSYAGGNLSFGFVPMAVIYVLELISSCHLNPAVTLGLTLSRKFDSTRLPSNIGVPKDLASIDFSAWFEVLPRWASRAALVHLRTELQPPSYRSGRHGLRTRCDGPCNHH